MKKKQFLSMLLSVMMVFSLFTGTVSAEELPVEAGGTAALEVLDDNAEPDADVLTEAEVSEQEEPDAAIPEEEEAETPDQEEPDDAASEDTEAPVKEETDASAPEELDEAALEETEEAEAPAADEEESGAVSDEEQETLPAEEASENVSADETAEVAVEEALPETEQEDEMDAQAEASDWTVTIEKYDADGNGAYLMEPTAVEYDSWNSMIRYLLEWNYLVDSDDLKYNSYPAYIIGIADPDQDDGFLDNGDITEGSRWKVVLDGEILDETKSSPYADEGAVIRFIFSTEGDGSESGVSKDALLKTLAELTDDERDKIGNAYDNACAVALDPNASESDVTDAIASVEAAMNDSFHAVSVTLDPSELTLAVGQDPVQVTASVEPANTSDTVTWSVDNEDVATVDQNGLVTPVAEGTAVLTASANENATATAAITVKKDIPMTSLALKESKYEVKSGMTVQASVSFEPYNATSKLTWSVDNEEVATVDGNGLITGVAGGTATLTVRSDNGLEAEASISVAEEPYIYFEYADGSTQIPYTDNYGDHIFTLSALDQGRFVVGNTDESVSWDVANYVWDSNGSGFFHEWVDSETGVWSPTIKAPDYADVYVGGELLETFYIRQGQSGITELKAYVNGEEVTMDNPYVTVGTVNGVTVTVKGLKDGEWIDVPQSALRYSSDDGTGNFRFLGNTMIITAGGEATMTVSVLGENTSVSFKAECSYVAATGMTVTVPETFEIEVYNDYRGSYFGIPPKTGYSISFAPYNATNQEVTWEALTPDVAIHIDTDARGIVPLKAGEAKFRVTSVDNPSLTQEVSVTFVYKYPLESASAEESMTMKVGDAQDLAVTANPSNATEQRFNWTYSEEGIVRVADLITTAVGGVSGHTTTHRITALSEGTVTVTGTPYDDTAGCGPVSFTVTVEEAGEEPPIDYLTMAKDDIAHGRTYLNTQSKSGYGDEWTLFTILRSGGTVSDGIKDSYLKSVKEKLDSGDPLVPTDYARLVLTLGVMGKDPRSFEGYDLLEKIYNNVDLENDTSNRVCYSLIALDSRNYEIPSGAVWTREKLIDLVLQYQLADGSFGLSKGDASGSVDMTGMVLQSLVPYNNAEHPEVQAAFVKGLDYLRAQMDLSTCSYSNNACSTAQVLTVLASAGIDPTDPDNGFAIGSRNMVTNLHEYRLDFGFKYRASDNNANLMGTQQITYALESYRRYAEKANRLYDLTDVEMEAPETVSVEGVTLNKTAAELKAGQTLQLAASVLPVNASNKSVRWSSDSEAVAVVDESGLVTAKAAGTAVITVTTEDGGKTAQCTVQVTGEEPVTPSEPEKPEEPSVSTAVGTVHQISKVQYRILSSSAAAVHKLTDKTVKNMTVPETVTIGGKVFKVTTIGTGAYKNCTKLESVTLGKSVTVIGSEAFSGCTGLKRVKKAASVTAINKKAFYNCKKLTTIGDKTGTITLGKIKSIGNSAFQGCSALKKVNASSTALTKVNAKAFCQCTSLTSFTASSKKLTTIGSQAFSGCKKLANVTLKTTGLKKAKVGANAFKGIKSTCTFRVPSGKTASYQSILKARGAGSRIKVTK